MPRRTRRRSTSAEGVQGLAPTARPAPHRDEEDDERVVPSTNVGGATPTAGGDSGGDLPGPEDDLSNLAEPEAPAPADTLGHVEREGEVGAPNEPP